MEEVRNINNETEHIHHRKLRYTLNGQMSVVVVNSNLQRKSPKSCKEFLPFQSLLRFYKL